MSDHGGAGGADAARGGAADRRIDDRRIDEHGLYTSGLYERAEVMEVVESALTRLCEGYRNGDTDIGTLLRFSGEAGLGKTALLGELRRSARARQDHCLVLYARGGEQQRNVPFHVVRQLLQPTLLRKSVPERREFLEGGWLDLAAPALGLVPASDAVGLPVPPDPQGIRDALDLLLTQLAVRMGPLVVVVDDLHWADPESLAWLVAFASRLPGVPLLMALAFRPESLPMAGDPLLSPVLGGSDGLLSLRQLGPVSVETLVRQELGADADDMFCRECWSKTGGNPYDLVALIARLRERSMPPNDEYLSEIGGLVAANKGPGIARRLEKLGTDAYRFAYAAAILDTQIDPDMAANIAGLNPAAARAAVEKLRTERLLRSEYKSDGTATLEFVHPTIGTALYETMLSPSMRTAMHGKAAREIIDAGLSMAEASRHLLETHPEDDLLVVEQLRQAADQHLAMGAPAAAHRCLERALREPPAEEDRADLLFELGRSALLTDPTVTVNHLRAALTTRPGLRVQRREEVVLRLGQALGHSNQMGEAARVTAEEVERTQPGPARVLLETAYYMWRGFLRDVPDGPGHSQRLAELSAARGDGGASSHAVQVLRAWDLTLRGEDSQQVVELAGYAFEDGSLVRDIGWTNTIWGFEIPIVLCLSYIYNDRLDLASELANEGANTYELAGWSGGHLAFVNFVRGLALFRWGRLAEAESFLRSTLRASLRLGRGLPLEWDVIGVLCETLMARGRLQEAVDLAQQYGFGPPFPPVMVLPDAPTLYGRLLLAQGRRKDAVQQLEQAGAGLEARGWRNPVWAPWAGELARALAPESPERAAELAEKALQDAERVGSNSAIGIALRTKAALAAPAEALDLLRQSVEALGKSPAAYEHALALVDYGSALRRAGRPRDAVSVLEQGVELATQCGADGLSARGQGELVAAGASPHRMRAVETRALNARERQAAELAVEGLTVRKIAARMRVSENEARRLLASAHRKVGAGPEGLSRALEPGE